MSQPDKRHQIMKAAEKLFTTRRFHEITLDDVAAAAGVGKGTIYRYFQDKEDLFFETTTGGFDDLCSLLQQKVQDQAPFQQQLLTACVQISGFFHRRNKLFRMMQSEEGRMIGCKNPVSGRWMDRRKKLVQALTSILGRGVQSGQLRSDIPPETLSNFLLGLLRARARSAGQPGPDVLQKHELVVDFFLRGAGAAPATGAACGQASALGLAAEAVPSGPTPQAPSAPDAGAAMTTPTSDE